LGREGEGGDLQKRLDGRKKEVDPGERRRTEMLT